MLNFKAAMLNFLKAAMLNFKAAMLNFLKAAMLNFWKDVRKK
jgi:hypothetical protein